MLKICPVSFRTKLDLNFLIFILQAHPRFDLPWRRSMGSQKGIKICEPLMSVENNPQSARWCMEQNPDWSLKVTARFPWPKPRLWLLRPIWKTCAARLNPRTWFDNHWKCHRYFLKVTSSSWNNTFPLMCILGYLFLTPLWFYCTFIFDTTGL